MKRLFLYIVLLALMPSFVSCRKHVSSYGGDPLSAGEEVSQSYSFTIDESICNADNLAAVVYSLRYENGVLVADNAVKVALGDSIDYRYDD